MKDVRDDDIYHHIYLIRHGTTAYNAESGGVDRIRGMKNVPLSAKGRQEVKELADHLANSGIDVLVTSPLSRAQDTAEAIKSTTKARLIIATEFCPWDLGEFTGQESVSIHPTISNYALKTPDRKVPGGESFNEFRERVFSGLRKHLRTSDREMVAIVTHHRPERLMKAWQARGEPSDMSIDFNVMFQYGEHTAHSEKFKINKPALMETALATMI